jgi:hypothetical protein
MLVGDVGNYTTMIATRKSSHGELVTIKQSIAGRYTGLS